MTNDQLSRLRLTLRGRLSEIEQKTLSLREDLLQTAEVQPTIISDMHDHAKEAGDLNNRLGVHHLHMSFRDQLRDALQKIERGTFGQCACCGKEIGARRLEVQPSAVLCLGCQQKSEAKTLTSAQSVAWVSPERFNCFYWGAA